MVFPGAHPHPSTAGLMCMLAGHVAARHNVGTGRQIGLFWVETNTELFRQHMFRYLACPRVGFACCISLVRGRVTTLSSV